jgi:hypothetical protein
MPGLFSRQPGNCVAGLRDTSCIRVVFRAACADGALLLYGGVFLFIGEKSSLIFHL